MISSSIKNSFDKIENNYDKYINYNNINLEQKILVSYSNNKFVLYTPYKNILGTFTALDIIKFILSEVKHFSNLIK